MICHTINLYLKKKSNRLIRQVLHEVLLDLLQPIHAGCSYPSGPSKASAESSTWLGRSCVFCPEGGIIISCCLCGSQQQGQSATPTHLQTLSHLFPQLDWRLQPTELLSVFSNFLIPINFKSRVVSPKTCQSRGTCLPAGGACRLGTNDAGQIRNNSFIDVVTRHMSRTRKHSHKSICETFSWEILLPYLFDQYARVLFENVSRKPEIRVKISRRAYRGNKKAGRKQCMRDFIRLCVLIE